VLKKKNPKGAASTKRLKITGTDRLTAGCCEHNHKPTVSLQGREFNTAPRDAQDALFSAQYYAQQTVKVYSVHITGVFCKRNYKWHANIHAV
jgi:hypothetical protein